MRTRLQIVIALSLTFTALVLLFIGGGKLLVSGAPVGIREAFAEFLPGQPLPVGIACTDYYGYWIDDHYSFCRYTDLPPCEVVWVSGGERVSYVTTRQCGIRLGDVVREFGAWRTIRHYRRLTVISWQGVYVMIRARRVSYLHTIYSLTLFS